MNKQAIFTAITVLLFSYGIHSSVYAGKALDISEAYKKRYWTPTVPRSSALLIPMR